MAAVAVGVLVALSGCSSDGGPSACGEVEVDPLDPQSVVHVLPGAPDPDDADPLPTSGVHVMDPRVAVVSDEPLPRAIAVGVRLEARQLCMELRGAESPGLIITTALRGEAHPAVARAIGLG